MSGSGSVTVPGSSGVVTVALGTGDVLHLAAQIGALLATIQGGNDLNLTTAQLGAIPPAPAVSSPTVTDLNIVGNVSGGSDTIPSGYTYAVDVNTLPSTVTGSNIELITGTAGGSFNVSGISTVAATGGNNNISANGVYLISTGDGNDTVSASGYGTVATDLGNNAIYVNGNNEVLSIGQDTVVAGIGLTTVISSGSQSQIFGNTGAGDLLFVSLTGAQSTVSTFDSDASITIAGSQDLVVGAQALSNIIVSGNDDTVEGGSGAETITASSNPVVFGGTGPITFVGGAGTATIVGAPGGTEQVSVGAGGIIFSANTSNAGALNSSTITSGVGGATIFGAPDSDVNYQGSQSPATLVGFGGNETLNAAGSTTKNVFSAGSLGGSVSMVGGSGLNTFFAGDGSATMTGGGHNDAFAFFDGTTGGNNYITDFNATDSLYLIGYSTTQSASSLLASAKPTPAGIELTLSDNTTITFTNLTSTTPLDGHILYGPKP